MLHRALLNTRFRVLLIASLISAYLLSAGCGGSDASDTTPPPSPVGSVRAIVDSRVAIEMKAGQLPGMTIELAKRGNLIYA
jgi:hypothetical protein